MSCNSFLLQVPASLSCASGAQAPLTPDFLGSFDEIMKDFNPAEFDLLLINNFANGAQRQQSCGERHEEEVDPQHFVDGSFGQSLLDFGSCVLANDVFGCDVFSPETFEDDSFLSQPQSSPHAPSSPQSIWSLQSATPSCGLDPQVVPLMAPSSPLPSLPPPKQPVRYGSQRLPADEPVGEGHYHSSPGKERVLVTKAKKRGPYVAPPVRFRTKDPLPTVWTLEQLQLSTHGFKELCRHLTPEQIEDLKQARRRLKNREYARVSRHKRLNPSQ